jgi:DNA-binding response OmpR family regulator
MMLRIELPDQLQQRLVLAHSDLDFATSAKRRLVRLGWEVYQTRSAAGARRLAEEVQPAVFVLDTDLPDETGWLLCAKLKAQMPETRVILVDDRPSLERARYARFVGANALVRRQQRASILLYEIVGAALLV